MYRVNVVGSKGLKQISPGQSEAALAAKCHPG